MTGVLDALLPWLAGQQPLQWIGLLLVAAAAATCWTGMFYLARDGRLAMPLAVAVAGLSTAFGLGALALGRYIAINIGEGFAATPQGESPYGAGFAALTLVIGEVLVGIGLLLGLLLALALDPVDLSPATSSFLVIAGAGVVLWIAHEITLIAVIAYNGWPVGA